MPPSILTPTRARRLLAKYRAGTSTQAAFCKRYRVSASLFSYWLHRLQAANPQDRPAFQEVSLPPPLPSQASCVLVLPGGARLEFPVSHLEMALKLLSGEKVQC